MNRLAMRRAWFQVHKWIGLSLAVLIIPLSASGAALVWHDALDRLVNPARYAVTGSATLPPERYLEAARARLGAGDRVASLAVPARGGPVVVAAAPAKAPARPGPPPRTMVYLDPPTARVLDAASSASGVMRTIHVLHGSLLVPGWGRTVVGWIGVAMAVSCFTGLWLWWPTVGRWARGLRWGRHRSTDTNLHYLFGFWVALPLFVLSVTGAWISFPAFFGALSGGGGRGPDRGAALRAPPLASPARPLAQVLASAARFGGGAPLTQVTWPTERSPDWTVTFGGAGEGRGRSVKVADDTGYAEAAPARERGGVAGWMRRVHSGEGTPLVWQAVVFLGGLIPVGLAVTGVVMWWRARSWRAGLAGRRARAAVPAE